MHYGSGIRPKQQQPRGLGQWLWAVFLGLAGLTAQADDLPVIGFLSDGTLTVTNAFTNGVVTVERAASLGGLWVPDKNVFSTGPVSQVSVTITGRAGFFRALAADLSGSNGFSNLTQAYGLLSTIAGSGASNCTPCNDWQSSFEGGLATNAALSHPHIAMAD